MKTGRHIFAYLLLASFCLGSLSASGADGTKLQFYSYGKKKSALTLPELQKALAPTEVKVYEPHKKEEQTYIGFNFNKLMDSVYGDTWHKAEEILFTCSDGYQPSLPVARFKEFQSFLSYSFAPAGQKFELVNRLQNDKLTELGPFYLVWDNLKNETLKSMGGLGWPYQVVSIDIINFSDHFPKLVPKKLRLNEAEQRGFVAFRTHCISCHTINGEGGTLSGIDLNSPVSVIEFWRNDWLAKWIANPAAIRPKSQMPPLNSGTPAERDAKIKDIITYLRLMSMHKVR